VNIIPQLYHCLDPKENEILGKSTLNIGKIVGGTKINIVPDYSELEVDFRLIPEIQQDNLINKLKLLQSDFCNIEIDIMKDHPALQTDKDNLFIKNLKKLANTKFIGLPYATDAAYYVDPNKSIPFVIFGPGDPNIIHKTNEWVSLENVFKATELLTEAILQTFKDYL
jgi:succinyl-diaminopimelate desuccinylase